MNLVLKTEAQRDLATWLRNSRHPFRLRGHIGNWSVCYFFPLYGGDVAVVLGRLTDGR